MTDDSVRDLRRERAARNQSLFREVNERIESLDTLALFASFLCECADQACDAIVSMTLEEYETVRAHGNTFLILPGHELPEVEEIVDACDRFLVVRKLGVAADLAEARDPRRP